MRRVLVYTLGRRVWMDASRCPVGAVRTALHNAVDTAILPGGWTDHNHPRRVT